MPNRYVQRKVNFPSCDYRGRSRVASCKRWYSSSELRTPSPTGCGLFLGICRSGPPLEYDAREAPVTEGVTQQDASTKKVAEGMGIGWLRVRAKRWSSSNDLRTPSRTGCGLFLGIFRSGDPLEYDALDAPVTEGVTQQVCFNKKMHNGWGSGGFV